MIHLLRLPVAFVLVSSVCLAQSLRTQIESADKAVREAMLSKDFVALKRTMRATTTKNFTYIENGKPIGLEETISTMIGGLTMMKKVTMAKASLLTLSQHGDHASGTTRHEIGGVMVSGNKAHNVSYTGLTNDAYVKEGGAWKLAKMVWTNMKMTMDGKTMGLGSGARARSRG